MSIEVLKTKLQAKIESLKQRLAFLNGEIANLDRQLIDKRAEFIRTEGAITGFQMTLNEIGMDEMKIEEEKLKEAKEDVSGESENEG